MDIRAGQRYFEESFKQSIVSEIETGQITIQEVKSMYGILGHSTILNWCRLYGKKAHAQMKRKTENALITNTEDEKVLLRNQIKVLEQELKDSRWKQATLETLIDIAEKHYSIVIKKNSGQKR